MLNNEKLNRRAILEGKHQNRPQSRAEIERPPIISTTRRHSDDGRIFRPDNDEESNEEIFPLDIIPRASKSLQPQQFRRASTSQLTNDKALPSRTLFEDVQKETAKRALSRIPDTCEVTTNKKDVKPAIFVERKAANLPRKLKPICNVGKQR
ncbi:Uncharacterised protein r2_g2203 [Pycnogonum litorale]